MFVKVAIDLSLGKLFAYTVPDALQKKLAVGQLLSVQFGHRKARAFAMEICAGDPPAEIKARPIAGIVDETPFFSKALLELVGRISAYTASPVESVLRAAVPAAVSGGRVGEKVLAYVEPVEGASIEEAHLTARQLWVCKNVFRLKGGWAGVVKKELKTTDATLKLLASRGLVKIEMRQSLRRPISVRNILPTKPLHLNPSQKAALDAINALSRGAAPGKPSTILLRGVTGSGKTEVYLQAIADVVSRGKGAITLVPEIALTPQTVGRFASRFGDKVAVLHSALSEGERRDEWHRIRSGVARVVVGPRSAVFAPVADLGLIVVDEEHETSYKQEDLPRYNARDTAVLRGSIEGAAVVLGSATPSLESWYNAISGKYSLVEMDSRAGAGTTPSVRIVDMEENSSRGRIFSRDLADAIKDRLDSGEQTILFLNRRGYSRSAQCPLCGHVETCPECSLPYTYHSFDECLRCHVCGRWAIPPAICPECSKSPLEYRGIGTQRVENALAEMFPSARILRMDADSTGRRRSHDEILGMFRRREADILVGTQMIAKGLDFPSVTLVGVLNADSSLNMPDFRACERTFQLISQVAGRAGRANLPGEVYVQTYNPASQVIRAAAAGDFKAFAKEELAVRKAMSFPPFCRMSLVRVKSRSNSDAEKWAGFYSAFFAKIDGVAAGGAVPSAIEKADGWFRWQVSVKSANASSVARAWRWICEKSRPPSSVVASIDIDAFNFA